jgi:1-deoxy-D-xylulose-5-phosphate reductoisomerase
MAQAERRVAIYGSTGSIGTQTLKVVDNLNQNQRDYNYRVVALVCDKSIELLEQQISTYKPESAAVINTNAARMLRKKISSGMRIGEGMEEAIQMCISSHPDIVIHGAVGMAGLIPTVRFIEKGMTVGLANKESIVAGGDLVMRLVKEHGAFLIPVDSEHSGVFQLLRARDSNKIHKLTITASGGPFLKIPKRYFDFVTYEQAVNHPTYKMGGRISVDSASLMNKGFEVIEASKLFGVPPEDILVLIHPTSTVHAMVAFVDGTSLIHAGLPNMLGPIQYALTYPSREVTGVNMLELADQTLVFKKPDTEKFECLKFAYAALEMGGAAGAVLNAADEVAVEAFKDKKIKFSGIPILVGDALSSYKVVEQSPTLEQIMAADSWAREYVRSRIASGIG